MANPNIVNVTSIYGKTAVQAVTTTPTAIVTNSSGSGKVLKINTLYVSNVNGSVASSINIDVFRSSTPYYVAFAVSAPANSVLDVISKPIYLEEGDVLRLTAGANNYLNVVCSYEEIS